MKKIVITAVIVVASAAAYCDNGGEPFAFLKLGVGSRATAMGGAFTAVSDDASGAFYNPAGLVGLSGLELSAETYFLSFGRSMNYVSTVKPFTVSDNSYSAGISWVNYSGGSGIEVRNTNSPDPAGTISDAAHVIVFSTAAEIDDNIYLGASFKLMFHMLGDAMGTGVGFDAGAMFKLLEHLTAAVTAMNLSANLGWDNSPHSDTLPQVITGGLAYRIPVLFGVEGLNLLLAGDFSYNSFGYVRPKAGIEAEANRVLYIRAGYNESLSLGLGLRLEPSSVFTVKFDYAFVPDNIIPDAYNQRLSVTVEYIFPHWGTVEEKQEKVKEKTRGSEEPW